MLSPLIGVHWPTNQTWTDADQADWEAWFIPRAKVPSAKVLMKRVMPQVLCGIKATAKEESRGAVRTLQCDGWTLHAVHVHDVSGDSCNAEELLKQIIELINQVEKSHKAQQLLRAKFLHLVTPDCLAHQFNLIMGDLFKAKDDYGQYELLIMKHEADIQSTGDACSRAKISAAIATIRNPTFWHAMARWKNLLEPITLMMNIHQAAHSKPEHIPISFGFLYYHYSIIGDESDLVAQNAVLESAEHRWAQVDQEVFIAAVIVNPLYKDKPFSNIPLTIRAGLMFLFSRLWTCFYGGTPPLELFTDLDNYLKSSPEFQPLDIYTQILVSRANDQGTPVDPLDIWDGFSHSNSEIKPLQKIAHIFGAILTKWQNRLSTQNLMLLAELKMYLHEEHVHTGSVRKRLKQRYCQNTTSEVNQSAESSCVTAEDDADAFVDPQQTSSEVHGHRGLWQIAAQLIQAVEDEESFTTSEIMEAVTNPSDFQRIPIKDLFDFSCAQDWLGSFYQTAIQGLDAEIELYELLDLDAKGIDNPEFPHADEILDE
ncbi:hypothetical protein BDR03DRAFT_979518 [Suillus americanus]|nr:hypothetical protein BDR03DRAFT_979518 [Suillus americanus]